MQTFLPYANFQDTAKALDYRRLGKQRVEAFQILKALRGETKGWRNHPAALMWTGCEAALCVYAIAVCEEWIARGYRDTMLERFQVELARLTANSPVVFPEWLGSDDLHRSHRANLVRKDPDFYGPVWPEVDPASPYIWPHAA